MASLQLLPDSVVSLSLSDHLLVGQYRFASIITQSQNFPIFQFFLAGFVVFETSSAKQQT